MLQDVDNAIPIDLARKFGHCKSTSEDYSCHLLLEAQFPEHFDAQTINRLHLTRLNAATSTVAAFELMKEFMEKNPNAGPEEEDRTVRAVPCFPLILVSPILAQPCFPSILATTAFTHIYRSLCFFLFL